MVTIISYLILAVFFAISFYALGGMIYLGFKTWKEDKTNVRKLHSRFDPDSKGDKHLIAS